METIEKEKEEKTKIAGDDLMPLSEAAEIAGCTPEHLNLMARKKKLEAKKLGRNWYTTKEWVETYLENVEREKNLRRGIIKIRRVVDEYLNLPQKISDDKKDIFIKDESVTEKKFETTRSRMIKKTFLLGIPSALALIIFLLYPLIRYEVKKDLELEKVFSEIDATTFFNQNQGIVMGEETERQGNAASQGVALASENFKIKQITFGGEGSLIDESENISPEIQNAHGETFMNKKQDEVKLMITWATNKLALSEVEYSQIGGQNPRTLKENNYGFNHGVIIPGMEVGKAYVYKIKIRDRWGNEADSGYYSTYGGSKTVSVFELISQEFNEMFGWAVKSR